MSFFKKKKEPCKDCEDKKQRLGDKYSLGSIREALDRILRISDQGLAQGKGGYLPGYIAARCTLSEDITKDTLDTLCAVGLYARSDEGYYHIVVR